MQCPECATGKLYTAKTATSLTDAVVYRKRRCSHCGVILYTVERETADTESQFKSAWSAEATRYYHAKNHNHKES